MPFLIKAVIPSPGSEIGVAISPVPRTKSKTDESLLASFLAAVFTESTNFLFSPAATFNIP